MEVMAASQARESFSTLLRRAAEDGARTVISRRGQAQAALVPIDDLRFLQRPSRRQGEGAAYEIDRLADFAEAGADWFWETDSEHRFVHASLSSREASGIGPEHVLGNRRSDLIDTELDGHSLADHAADLEAHRAFKDFRYGVRPPDGARRWTSTSGKPIFDPHGEFLGYRGIGRDITEEVEASHRLLRLQETLFVAIENLSETFELWDGDDRLVMRNGHARELNRHSGRALDAGNTFEDFIREVVGVGQVTDAVGNEAEWLAERLRRHREPGEPFEVRRADGRWLMIREERLPDGGTVTATTDITALKDSETRLRQARDELEARVEARTAELAASEAQMRLIADNMPVLMAQFDNALRFRFVNSVCAAWYDAPAEGLIGYDVRGLLGEANMRALEPYMQRALRGETVMTEAGVTYPDGVTRDVEVTYIPQRDRDAVVGCFAFVRDITELKRRRRELEESHDLLQALMDSMPELVAVKKTDRRYLFVNKTFESWFQVNRDSVYGRTIHDFMPEDFGREIDEIEARVLEGRVSVSLERDFTGPDGITRPLSSILFPVLDAAGETIALGLISRDETEKKIEEKERNRLLNAVESLAEGFAVFDAKDRFVVCNDQYLELAGAGGTRLRAGITYEEILRRAFRDDIIPEAVDDPDDWLAGRMRRHHNPHGVFRVRRGERDIAIREARLPDGGWVVSLLDVTEQTAREEQLRQAQKMEAVGQLTGGVAHDFNNLMAIIQGNVTLLDRSVGHDPDLKSLIDPTLNAVRRGASLTHRLLAFSRRQALDVKSFSVGALLDGLGDMLRRTLGEHIALDIAVARDLWPCTADPGLLEQAILNLANNARDAMPGGGQLSITVANGHGGANAPLDDDGIALDDHVAITVSDTGGGMTESVRDQMFEPFFTTKPVGEGSGLGLSMVYGFIKQSQGQIDTHSAPGHGTTVTLRLPRGANTTAAVTTPAPESNPGVGRTVLVVEDDDDLRRVVTMFLSEIGYRVVDAANGRDALQRLQGEDRLDLLLTDIMLPGGLDGLQLSALVADKFPISRCLYMSGYPDNALEHHGDLDPSFRALRKPFELDRLADEIRLALAP